MNVHAVKCGEGNQSLDMGMAYFFTPLCRTRGRLPNIQYLHIKSALVKAGIWKHGTSMEYKFVISLSTAAKS